MAATACAYGYQGTRPPLMPETFIDDVADGPVPAKPASPPPPRLSTKVHPSFLSRHLGLCTEGLGSESSGDIDLSDLTDGANNNDAGAQALPLPLPCKRQHRDYGGEDPGRSRSGRPAFPPPISVIGAGGKPWLYLRPHREDGRLVLREVRIPSRELLQARREDGRFKLQFAQPQTQPEDQEPPEIHHQQCQQDDQEPSSGNEELRVLDFCSEV